jgi:PucR family transcriptional regulator, purine catabolism regulatory protein
VPELRLIDPTRPQEHRVRVRDVLSFPPLRDARLIAGERGLDAAVTGINIMQVPTDEFAKQGALLLAGPTVFTDLDDPEPLLEALVRRRIGGLAIRSSGQDGVLPPAAVRFADRRNLPLMQLPTGTHLGELMTELLGLLVANQYTTQRSAGDVRAELSGYVLSGGDLDGLPDAIAQIVRGDVVLFDQALERIAASASADVDAAKSVARAWVEESTTAPMEAVGEGWIVWPVRAGAERLGALVARPDHERELLVYPALQHGSTNAALQMLQEREAASARVTFREGFFRDLLQGSVDSEAAQRRAAAIGWVFDAYRIMLVSGSALDEATIAQRLDGALVVRHGDALLAVLPDPSEAAESLAGVHVGLSAVHVGVDALPTAVAEAEEALRAARLFDDRVNLRRFEELGPLRMLAHVDPDELQAFHTEVLAPLDALADDVRSKLVRTLELLLATGLNVAETARRGGWHYNTVRYRVARLTELLGPFFTDGTRLESLSLALLLRTAIGSNAPRRYRQVVARS